MSAVPSTRAAASSLPVLVFTALAGTMAMMAFVAVIGPVVRVLGLAEWHAGLSVTAAGVLWMLAARRWGGLSDRIGRRRVLLIALAAYAVIYLAMAVFVDLALRHPPAVIVSVVVLVATRALVGLFYAAVPPTAAALVADEVPPGSRASTMARLGAANALGMVFGPAAAGWIASRHLGLALYVVAALPLLSLLLVWWRLPDQPPPARAAPGPRAALAWFDPRLRLPVFAVFAAMVSVTIAQVVVGFFAIDRFGLSPAEGARLAGLALTCVGAGLMGSQLLVMRLRAVPPVRFIAIGAVVAAVGFGACSLVVVQWQLLVAYAVAAFGMGFVFPAFQGLAADAVQAHEQGAAQGTVASVQGLGMVVGPMLGTMLYARDPATPYQMVALVLLVLAAVAGVHARQRRCA